MDDWIPMNFFEWLDPNGASGWAPMDGSLVVWVPLVFVVRSQFNRWHGSIVVDGWIQLVLTIFVFPRGGRL